jgi:hypothetical protein
VAAAAELRFSVPYVNTTYFVLCKFDAERQLCVSRFLYSVILRNEGFLFSHNSSTMGLWVLGSGSQAQ